MIKRWQKTLNSINRLLDLFVLFISYFISAYLWLILIKKNPTNIALMMTNSAWLVLGLSLLIVFAYQLAGLYDSVRAKPFSNDIRRVLLINTAVAVGISAMLFVFHLENFSRGTIAMFFLLSSLAVLAKRALTRIVLSQYRSRGFNQKHVVLIGNGRLASEYIETIRKYPRFGFTIDGYIGASNTIPDLQYYGVWEEIGQKTLARADIDEVVVALDEDSLSVLPQILFATEKHGAKVSIIPYFNDYVPTSTTIQALGECKLLNVRSIPLDSPANAVLKRALDLVCAFVFVVITSPVMLFTALGVKLSSPGPVLFRQTRVGKNKRNFQMYKFRSMRVNPQETTGWTRQDDPRKTKFGSFIRKTSIDELPQFFNVLKGDMSLVGPRPEIPHFVDQFKETIPLYMLKHRVLPGITGWAQVKGYRGDTSIEERIRHDIWYIENWSIWMDIRILGMTVFGGLINNEPLRAWKRKQDGEMPDD